MRENASPDKRTSRKKRAAKYKLFSYRRGYTGRKHSEYLCRHARKFETDAALVTRRAKQQIERNRDAIKAYKRNDSYRRRKRIVSRMSLFYPDFGKSAFRSAIQDYAKNKRRLQQRRYDYIYPIDLQILRTGYTENNRHSQLQSEIGKNGK